ncbi:hypothetical protein [Haloarchaeobius salinus]|uniref:hypothetical protein n=1 Tax=Haloarchaeobius salinus TaxID=1198298 RepID=UPI002108B8D3|nr:hypothetical protein [Haloarchaeobius salinus]
MVNLNMLFWGGVVAVFGVVGYRYAYELSRFSEQLDAIGSKRAAAEVEPADWKVALERGVSGLLAIVGAGMVVGAFVL